MPLFFNNHGFRRTTGFIIIIIIIIIITSAKVIRRLILPSTVFPTMKWRHHVEPEIRFSCRSTYFLFENVLKKDMYSPEARAFIETSCFASHVCAGFWLSNNNHWLGNSICLAWIWALQRNVVPRFTIKDGWLLCATPKTLHCRAAMLWWSWFAIFHFKAHFVNVSEP